MIRLKVAALCVVLASWQGTPGRRQNTPVHVGLNVALSPRGASQTEPFIAADPSKPGVLVIATTEWLSDRGFVPQVHVTTNGGRTWTRSVVPGITDDLGPGDRIEAGADPWITFGTGGQVSMVLQPYIPRKDAVIRVFRSANSGKTWEAGYILRGTSWDAPKVVIVPDELKPAVLLILIGGGRDLTQFGVRASTGSLAMFRSEDGGRSFEPSAVLTGNGRSLGIESVAVLNDGVVLVLFGEFTSDSTVEPPSARHRVARSVDGGRTFKESAPLASVPRQYPDIGSLAVDSSHGPFGGRVYATWEPGDFGARSTLVDGKRIRNESGTTRGVAIASSLDGARTWLPPIRLEVPNAGPPYMPTAAVSPRGTVGVLWVQHERYETNPLCYRPYFAASTDGGASFSQAVAVADRISCPTRSPSQPEFFTYRPRGGDYIGLAASADGSFHAAWSDARDGSFRTYTARIDVPGAQPTR